MRRTDTPTRIDWYRELYVPRGHRGAGRYVAPEDWSSLRCLVTGVHLLSNGLWGTPFPGVQYAPENANHSR